MFPSYNELYSKNLYGMVPCFLHPSWASLPMHFNNLEICCPLTYLPPPSRFLPSSSHLPGPFFCHIPHGLVPLPSHCITGRGLTPDVYPLGFCSEAPEYHRKMWKIGLMYTANIQIYWPLWLCFYGSVTGWLSHLHRKTLKIISLSISYSTPSPFS